MPSSSVIKILLDTVVDELGILRPSAYVGAQDIQGRQLLALFHQTGDYLVNQNDWQALIKEALFNTSPGIIQYGLPGDFAGMIDETMWNNTLKVSVPGPRNQSDWAAIEALHRTGPRFAQHLRADKINLQPAPDGYYQIYYYYLSSSWVFSAASGTAAYYDRAKSDLDKVVWYDDRLIISGVKAAWLRAKRLSYDEEWDLFQQQIRKNIEVDRGAQTLSMDPSTAGLTTNPTGLVIPAGNWGG